MSRIKSIKLSINQRIIAILLYLSLFIALCLYFNGGDLSSLHSFDSEYRILFLSGALLLILGTYITEPYFTKPVDVVTNTIAVILALWSIKEPSAFVWYNFVFIASWVILISSIAVIFFSQLNKFKKAQYLFYETVTYIGSSKLLFSVMYLLTLLSYFGDRHLEFAFFLTFWFIFIFELFIEPLVLWISKSWSRFSQNKETGAIGSAIGCENPFLYKVEIDCSRHRDMCSQKGKLVCICLKILSGSKGVVGVVVNEKQLLNKKWLLVYLLGENGEPLKIDLKDEISSKVKTVFSLDNAVYSIEIKNIEDKHMQKMIEDNPLYKNRSSFIGYVARDSNISKVRFHSLLNATDEKHGSLREGVVIKTDIHNQNVLYQVIDANTFEERLEDHDIHGYTIGIAHKLGVYDTENKELDVAKWLPDIYTPIFFDETDVKKKDNLAIGRLPGTKLEIVLKDTDALVTHNTAILGILGIGKSCLTFELIKKVIENTDVKIICLDITNEYKKELPQYIEGKIIEEGFSKGFSDSLKKTYPTTGDPDNPSSWGNKGIYEEKLSDNLKLFIKNKSKRVLLLNPDEHAVAKAGAQFKIAHKADLTAAEKTRMITERMFLLAREEWESLSDEERGSGDPKYLFVFEEAHSLIPERNSTANSEDQNASNGTARVILQGRKYGLGSFVITQRTANISKSILNQCNTIFALRVFDDTGKQFLENYIGSDYSNTLPTLEERHAIAVGKAMKLKQPVIVRLNEREDVIKKVESATNNNQKA